MYQCFRRDATSPTHIINKMGPYIITRGQAIVQDEALLKSPIDFAKQLLNFKEEIDHMVTQSFASDVQFTKCRDASFRQFMNACDYTPAHLAYYTDEELKRGLKGASDDEVDRRLTAIVRLFCCLDGRDIYIRAYTGFLAKRLLNKTLLSKAAEEKMLEKLKIECGVNVTNGISKMFSDMDLSKDLQIEFVKQRGPQFAGITFTAEVLTQGIWTTEKAPNCKIPLPMKQCTDSFKLFYTSKHHNRRLEWLFLHGQCEVTPLFADKPYQLITTVFQVSILDLFNN